MRSIELKKLREDAGLTQSQLAEKLEVSLRTVQNWEEGDKELPILAGMKVSAYFKDARITQNTQPIVVVDTKNEEVITTVPITAKAGYIRRYNDPEFIEDLPISILPEKKFRGLTTRAFQVEGPSMENTIKDKSWIYGTFVEQEYWELIKNHLVYILHIDDDIIIKRIHNKIKEAGIIVAYSDNSDFEPQVIEANEIRQIWKARRKLDGDFAKKIKVTQRIDDDINDDDDLY